MNKTPYINITAICLALLLLCRSYGQAPPHEEKDNMTSASAAMAEEARAIASDSVVKKSEVKKSDDFYDKLQENTGNSRLTRAVFNALVTDKADSADMSSNKTLVNESEYYSKFEGQKILEVRIYRNNIFEKPSSRRSLTAWANRVHVITREGVIRKSLLFKEGDEVSAHDIILSQQTLRSMSYISEADIVVVPSGGPSGGVDIIVVTRDRWTIGAMVESVRDNRYYVDVYDNNFLGYGNRLGVRTYVSYKGDKYGGNMLEYSMPNVWGTFFHTDLYAGEGYSEYRYGGTAYREFLKYNDYMAGTTLEQTQYYEGQTLADTTLLIRRRNIAFWLGKSFHNEKLNSNFFVIAGYNNPRYQRRPEVDAGFNTYYQSYKTLLLSAGIYRESFYNGHMIRGFGTAEDVPYGFLVEFTGGRYWGEFENKYYAGASVAFGRQQRIGYLRGEVFASTFFNKGDRPSQRLVGGEINYFSNLLPAGRTRIRQFVDLRYATGFDRYTGEGERLTFIDPNAPRGGMDAKQASGDNRLIISTETVVFAPWYYYGFRFALFGFWDSAWLGDNRNIFENPYYSTLGLGVRIKNERLIFSTLQVRFGLAIGKNGLMDYRNFRLSGETKLDEKGYRPEAPGIDQYRF